MLNSHDIKKINNKWRDYMNGTPGVTGFKVDQHGVTIWLLNESFRGNLPDSVENVDVDYRY